MVMSECHKTLRIRGGFKVWETCLRGGLDGCPACPGRLDVGKVRVAVPRVLSGH